MIPLLDRGKIPVTCAIVPTRVLVVDSEPLIRWSICAALTAEGYDAVGATDAAEASRLAAEWPPPRVVVVDLREPDADAADVLAWRALYQECRFLIMTTEPRAAGIDSARSHGIDVVEKPFDLGAIVERIGQLAGGDSTAPVIHRR